MCLAPGTRVGVYEVISLLGAGGMGEVYRARDSRLQRDVALKILPDLFASDADRLARFQREAQILASLAHPNIGHIYGLEDGPAGGGPHMRALVLELIEGPTLADRIAQGSIPLDEALPIAQQLCDALDAAHEHGIIHRDLKPANIKVREDGTVKVLDFGLAKLSGPPDVGAGFSRPELTHSPTLSVAFTGVGMILGTAAYMAPEQARGKAVDKRADIWAFGCVVFEMLTGTRAFDGTDATEMIAAVVRGEPDWSALPPRTPPKLVALLKRCFEKDPKKRLRDIGDVRFELDEIQRSPAIPASVAPPAARLPLWRRAVPYAVAVLVTAGVAGYTAWVLRPMPLRALVRFVINLPEGERFSNVGRHAVAISPSGTHIAFSANGQLNLRAIDQLEVLPLRGTEGNATTNAAGRNPFFSPDGRWVGFWQDGQLKKVSIIGGVPVTICAAANPFGASWDADDTILFGQGPAGISRVRGAGGTPEVLIKVDAGQSAHGPQMLPNGREVLFTLRPQGAEWDQSQIVVQSLDTGQRKVLIEGGRDARYVRTGHLIYALRGTLLAVPFNVDALEVTGGAVPLVDKVAGPDASQTAAAHFSISADGTLVYIPDTVGAFGFGGRALVWVDRQGREEMLKTPVRAHRYLRLSPDGQRVSVDIQDQQRDTWIWNLPGETLTRLTLDPAQEQYGVWTPDGRRVIFTSSRAGNANLFWQAADGTGSAEQLTSFQGFQYPQTVSPDGTKLIFRQDGNGSVGESTDLMVLPLQGDRRPQPLVQTAFNEFNAEISPDGRWLAYQSDESGRFEIYVRPFPNVGDGRWQVSTRGGIRPLWARSGKELFYMDTDVALMSAPVSATAAFTAGNPIKLFGFASYQSSDAGRTYDVSPDGRRFLMIKTVARATQGQDLPQASITVVQNWFEELKRRVPTR